MARLSALVERRTTPDPAESVDEHFVEMDDVMVALDRNLARERSARHVLSTFLGAPGVQSLVQIARAYAGSWPYMVDVVCMCQAAAKLGRLSASQPRQRQPLRH